MRDIQLSENFWLREFTRSGVAARMGRELEPTEEQIANLRRLCVLALQPLRDAVQRSIFITSGFRPEWLNTLIGGSQTSAHMDGRASDIVVAGMSPIAVCRVIERLALPVDQCIHEFGQWTHVGIAREGEMPRRQYLTARRMDGRTHYLHGLLA